MARLPLITDADDLVRYEDQIAANLARAYPIPEPTDAEVERFRVLLEALRRCKPRGSMHGE